QLGNAVFVRELHLRLPREQFGKHVFTEGEIGDGGDGPRRHGDERADHDPEGDWSEPRPALVDRTRAIRPAGIMLCRWPTRHSRSPPVPYAGRYYVPANSRHFQAIGLIFRESQRGVQNQQRTSWHRRWPSIGSKAALGPKPVRTRSELA